MTTATLGLDYDQLLQRTESQHAVASMAHTLYANQRAMCRNMVPWRNASKAVKREFYREARQYLGLQ
ncbi:hypothetical protein D3C76_855950 [compost metagenome]